MNLMEITNKITVALKSGIIWLSVFDNKGRTITAVPMNAGGADEVSRLLQAAIVKKLGVGQPEQDDE